MSESKLDQQNQTVSGPQTNIAGSVSGPVFSGNFNGPFIYYEAYKPGIPLQAPPLPPEFVPRLEISEPFIENLTSSAPHATMAISAVHGLGGMGKSTLAISLARHTQVLEHFTDGVLWVTLDQAPDVLTFLLGWIQALGDYQFKTLQVKAASAQLHSLLQDKACLLVIDDAWEVEHVQPFLCGGERCRALITTRRADIAAETGAKLYELDVMSPQQSLALFSQRLGRSLREDEVEPAHRLARAVDYLPLALDLAGARLTSGRVGWQELCEALESEVARLEALHGPRQNRLFASFNLSLDGLGQYEPAARKAFPWLGLLPKDAHLAGPAVAILWQTTETRADEILELLWNDGLLQPAGKMRVSEKFWNAYRMHDLTHDYARRLLLDENNLALPQAHAHLLANYQKQTRDGLWHSLPEDGYIQQRLAWHLLESGQVESLYALLCEETPQGHNGWFEARERLGQTSGFLADVRLAWELANRAGDIGRQTRCALLVTSLNSQANSMSPELLAALVQNRIWTGEMAMAQIRQMPSDAQRSWSLANLMPHLPSELLANALATAQTITELDSRAEALTRIAPHLPPEMRQVALAEALDIAHSLDNESRAKALAALIPHLPSKQGETVFAEAMASAQKIADERSRIETLEQIALYLPPAEALNAALRIENDRSRCQALVHLIPLLPPELCQTALTEALHSAHNILYEPVRFRALAEIIPNLQLEQLTEALVTARSFVEERLLPDLGYESLALAALASHLPAEQCEAARAEALGDARSILYQDDYRSLVLATISIYLPSELRPIALTEALDAIRGIGDIFPFSHALASNASYLQPELRQEAFAKALDAARSIMDIDNRCRALAIIAPHLPPELSHAAFSEALVGTRGKAYNADRARFLAYYIAPNLPAEMMNEAVDIANSMPGKADRSQVLVALVPHMSPDEALVMIHSIEEISNRYRILNALIPHLPPHLFGEALSLASSFPEAYQRCDSLTALAPFLPVELFDEALAAANSISNEYQRAIAQTALVPFLPHETCQAVLTEVLRFANSLSEESKRSKILIDVAPYLTAANRLAVLTEALVAARNLTDKGEYCQLLASISAQQPPEQQKAMLVEALNMVPSLSDEFLRTESLRGIIPFLTPDLFEEALRIANSLSGHRDQTVAMIASYLPPAKSLAIAHEIYSADERSRALVRIGPLLSPTLQLWQETLPVLALRTRKDLFSDLAALSPWLGSFGEEAVRETVQAIQDVVRWWP